MTNATFWVRYTDSKTGRDGMLSLASPDLRSPREAHKRARATAKERLAKKGVIAISLNSQCVG